MLNFTLLISGGHHGHKKYHKKGHHTTGFHKKGHKDEHHKEHKFYDSEEKKGDHKKYGSEHEFHDHKKGEHKKGEKHDSGYDEGHHGKFMIDIGFDQCNWFKFDARKILTLAHK